MSSKRKLDEQKKREEEKRLAELHKEYVHTFSDGPKLDKSWVKAGTVEGEKRGTTKHRELYKPKSKLSDSDSRRSSHHETVREERPPPKPEIPKRKAGKKSNLEMFKEELRAMQEERDERKRLRNHIRDCEERGIPPTQLTSSGRPSRFEATPLALEVLEKVDEYPSNKVGPPNFESDMNTTNLYLGNISPKMSEQAICELFGKYGPLASIKIMYPRTEDERAKLRHSGFVGFMRRLDAEAAFEALKGESIMGYEMRLSWGKCIPIPPRPIYVAPSQAQENLPPPPSGLPFNAQTPSKDWRPATDSRGRPDIDKSLDQTAVKVVIPTERNLLCLIHRTIEYVVREGPLFEAMVMNREMNNPMFRFLFENQSPAHVYYRWKLFSILQGDEAHHWNVRPFQMFGGGSLWIPPPMNPYMSSKKKDSEKRSEQQKKGGLNERQRDKLEDMLRDVTVDRVKVGETMVWCLEHADAAEEIVEILQDSLTIIDTPMEKKIARLYVLSDILHNTSVKLPSVSMFRKYFEPALQPIFKSMNLTYEKIEGRLKAEGFKNKVMSCFRAWEEWVIYPLDQLIRCQNIFLGLFMSDSEGDSSEPPTPERGSKENHNRPGSGNSADDDRAQEKNNDRYNNVKQEEQKPVAKFVPSKWETVDEDTVKAQAMTTSKWELLEDNNGNSNQSETNVSDDKYESRDSTPGYDDSQGGLSALSALSAAYTPKTDKFKLVMNEERRLKLREIEVKVMKYQDELEAGKRSRKMELSISKQIEMYRQKLLQKEREEAEKDQMRGDRRKKHGDRSRSPSPRRRRRSRSNSRGRINRTKRSRSRSPRRNSRRSRSRSLERYKPKKSRY